MKIKSTYFLVALSIAMLVSGCQGSGGKRIPSLRETYSKTDKNPFGAYIAYHQLAEMFASNTIREKKHSFTKTWGEISDNEALYVCITNNLYLNEQEVTAMLEYVDKGNDMFISAAYIDINLMKKLSAMQMSNLFYAFPQVDSMRTTATSFRSDPYAYYYMPFYSYFSITNNEQVKSIGFNEYGKANCIVCFHGKGKLFLHCEPRAFSNYFLLQKNNYQYMQHILSYTHKDPEHLYWDDYYNKLTSRKAGNNDDDSDAGFSTFGEVMKHPPLKAAFWLILLLLALYVLFEMKRRQRIIPPVKPNENTSVAFTETIGRLYLQKKDNKNIAEKMSTYFNEYIRNNYFLNTSHINDDFITTLSRKSGVDRNKVEILYRAMQQAQNKEEVSDYELLSLNEQIQKFYKK